MRRKKIEKIKEEIKKELLKEQMQSKEEKQAYVPPKEPVLYHDKDELYAIQRNFLKIFILSISIAFVFVAFLIIRSSFDNSKDKTNSKDNIVVEDNYNASTANLFELKNGEIPLSNAYVANLYSGLYFKEKEYFIDDSAYIYSNDELLISDIPNSYLLFMISKTDEFNQYIKEQGILTSKELCSSMGLIKIPTSELDKISIDKYNRALTSYDDFVYAYYLDGVFSTYIKFTYSDGYYISSCENIQSSLKYPSYARILVDSASKTDDNISINVKVAFWTQSGIYADYKLQKLISSDPDDELTNFIKGASTYEFIYKKGNNNYYLEKIVKNID